MALVPKAPSYSTVLLVVGSGCINVYMDSKPQLIRASSVVRSEEHTQKAASFCRAMP